MFLNINTRSFQNGLLLLFIFTAFSCMPSDVRKVLKKAGSNKDELSKVIEYYKKDHDVRKLQAAYFLIENMEDKYSVINPKTDKYYDLIKQVNRLKNISIGRDSLDKILKYKIDSMERIMGGLDPVNAEYITDVTNITAEYIIKNIDLAFRVWEMPWASHVSFDDFCEFILPYRVNNEPLSNWRELFYNELKAFRDSIKVKSDPKELTTRISYYLYEKWTHYDNFRSNGFFTDLVNMAKCSGGTCDQRYVLFAAMCRSIGLPVTIESTPQWTNYTGGHAWNVVLDKDGKTRPFNGGEDNMKFYEKNVIPMGEGTSLCTKVYRQTFASQKNNFHKKSEANSIPDFFRSSSHLLDVTENYDIPKKKFVLDLKGRGLNSETVYLACYNYGYDINYVACAKVKNSKADFGYIGLPALYLPMIIKNGESRLVHKPFVGTMDEQYQHFYNPDTTIKANVRLYRKFNFSGEFLSFAQGMIGSVFQGANNPDFSDAEHLDTIKIRARAYEEMTITNSGKYRYLRYLANDSLHVRIAEIEFWGMNNQHESECLLKGKVIGKAKNGIDIENNAVFANAFDGSIRTNFNAKAGSFVGIDLGQGNAAQITKIWYLPRNNFNEIEHGHFYELFYLTDKWISLGQQVADKHYLIYKNVPVDAFLLLKDLTDGRQERIFTYNIQNNEQVWW